MKRITFPGANYGFALPDGTVGRNQGGAVETPEGRVDWPGEGILRLDGVRWKGRLYLAGEGHQSGHAWLWNGKWRELGPTHGVGTCAFGDGYLFIAVPGNAYKQVNLDTFEETLHPLVTGSQGLRYVEGNVPVTGDATIGFNPAEFTIRNGILAGQGHDGGTLVNGHIIEPGEAYFVKLKNDGDNFGLYIVKFAENQGVAFFFTKAEAFALPDAPPPPPPPPPPPEKPVLQAPNEFATVQRVFAAHPEIDRKNEETRGRAVDYVIAALGGKPWGRKARNKDGTNLNTDGLVYLRTDGKHEIYDIIDGNSGGATWDAAGIFNPGENGYWAPGLPVDGGPVTPPPSGSSFAAAAAALEAKLAELTRTVQEQRKLIDALAAKTPENNSSLNGKQIALRSSRGRYLRDDWGTDIGMFDRDSAAGGETYTIEEK